MPYIHLETTSDLTENGMIPDILESLSSALATIEGMDSKCIKAYHSLISVWTMTKCESGGFARCTVDILKGRTEAQRVEIADVLRTALKDAFSESLRDEMLALHYLEVTLEIREMDSVTYRK